MARIEIPVASGSTLKLYGALWGPLYEAVLSILGSTGTILPIGDPKHGQPNATTFKTVGEEQVTFTWSEAPNSFDTKLDLTDPDSFQGIVPHVRLNGTDEEADTPDAAYWTRDDTGANPFSVGAWIRADALGSTLEILSKYDVTTGDTKREWFFHIGGSGTPIAWLYDQSANARLGRTGTAINANQWYFTCWTYDASQAVTGLHYYSDGSLDDVGTDSGGTYTAMEDTASKVRLGFDQGASAGQNFFNGKMAGGPLGPFFTQKELTADEVLRLYEIGRRTLAL